jgi:hypothetical protein
MFGNRYRRQLQVARFERQLAATRFHELIGVPQTALDLKHRSERPGNSSIVGGRIVRATLNLVRLEDRCGILD